VRKMTLVIALLCCAAMPLRVDAYTSGSGVAADMAATMWELMEWFFGARTPYGGGYGVPGGYANPFNHWYFPYSGAGEPYRNEWQNPWRYPQVLDGVWLAASGEYWLIKGNHFILVTADGRRFDGGFEREGPFLRVTLPQGMREFEFRIVRNLLVLHDVNGRSVTLQRIHRPHWRW